MIRHSPCELYLKYLILDDAGHTNQAIRDLLTALGLDDIGDAYLGRLREHLDSRPEVFQPRDKTHVPSMRFVLEAGVYDLFFPQEDVGVAFDILDSPRAKEFIETTLLSGAPMGPIALHLQKYHHIPKATESAVHKYKFFFWNTDLLDQTEMKAIIRLRYMRDADSDDEEQALHGRALSKGIYTDPRWIAAGMPQSPLSALLSQIAMGQMPSNVDLAEILKRGEVIANLRMVEELFFRAPGYDLRALNLSSTSRVIKELQESKARPEDDLRAQLELIRLRTDDSVLPHVAAISGGRHTADLIALPASKDPSNEPK